MKLMEENRQFVTRDPARAHLFYLPYSARQLQHALYVPNWHNIKPLSIFLRNYVKMLAAKYPFWNRTRGTYHFLVACHDWDDHVDMGRLNSTYGLHELYGLSASQYMLTFTWVYGL
ncbi:hypothetical protein Syun_011222 [Stephania yunnanensis]|uniref:Exostosin GT47 domain-containing protein n=1 Tax=Stephania yunnanensis TaxID=152371 RepID=A0AAP0JX49_9MAGN